MVNNAGLPFRHALLQTEPAAMEQVMRVNRDGRSRRQSVA